MNLNELAVTRRSVRHYKPAEMSKESVNEKLKEVLTFVSENAPSWKNSQTHRYYAAVSEEKITQVTQALVERNRPKCTNAVALIVSCFEKNVSGFTDGNPDNELANEWGAYDLGLSDSLLLLKARDLGFDTLIMGLRDSQSLRAALGIPDSQQVVSVISVGVREADPAVPGHKSLNEIAEFL